MIEVRYETKLLVGKAAAEGKSKTEISREHAGADQIGQMPVLRDLAANIEYCIALHTAL